MGQVTGEYASLAGRVALVSGGARGIGAAVARSLVKQGAKVVLGDLLTDEGQILQAELGPAARFQHLDVTDEAGWEAVVAATLAWAGGIDILVTCAGIVAFKSIDDLSSAGFDSIIATNLTGTFLGIKHAGRVMVGAGRGSIVTVSSSAGLEGGNGMAAYCASKWAVRGLSKVAAIELGQHGVRVNSVYPGPVDTKMTNPSGRSREGLNDLSIVRRMPLARVADPMEIANVCLFLASDASSFMTGAELAADGGATIGMYHYGRPGAPAKH